MGLADEIERSKGFLVPSGGCPVWAFTLMLDEDDRRAMLALVDDRSIYATRIVKVIRSWGGKLMEEAAVAKNKSESTRLEEISIFCGKITDRAIQRHRLGECSCRGQS